MTAIKLAYTVLTLIGLQCNPEGSVVTGGVAMSLDWLGDAARNAYCAADEWVDQNNAWLFGEGVANGLNSFLPNPCAPPQEPQPTLPGDPLCSAGSSFTFSVRRLESTMVGSGRPPTTVDRGPYDGYLLGFRYVPAEQLWVIDYMTSDGRQLVDSIIFADDGQQAILFNYRVTPNPGSVCGNLPNPGDRPPSAPPIRTPDEEIIPPPPYPQIPVTVNFNFFPPINLPAIVPVVIPVIARITPTVNFSPTVNIPFTLNLPDLTANFDFAFNPHFNFIDLSGNMPNWPPEGIPPESVLQECPEVELPPPLFKIEERIVGCYVQSPPGSIISGKTIVRRGSSTFDQSVYPRLGHVQFISSVLGFARVSGAPVTERLGYIPNPDPYGADAVQFNPEPGVSNLVLYAVRRPVAIPIKTDGTSPTGFEAVTLI